MGARVSSNPATSTIAAKLPRPVIDRLRAEAYLHDRTLSGQIRRVLREWAENAGGDNARA